MMGSNEIELSILGSSSATPTDERHTSAQLLRLGHRALLIDCGEGCQMALRRMRAKVSAIDNIFISHLHGDHYFGLAPLMSTLHLMGRVKPLHIFADQRLQSIVDLQFMIADTELRYPVVYHALEPGHSHVVLEEGGLRVTSFPLDHRIPTWGFRFDQDFGQKEMLSYAYVSDTRYEPDLIRHIKGVDLLYHEATFLNDMAEFARAKYHSTAEQAALIARDAGASWLLIGHFSTRYHSPARLLDEARLHFPNTIAAADGLRLLINTKLSVSIRKGFEFAPKKA